jgi:hypothetical protein
VTGWFLLPTAFLVQDRIFSNKPTKHLVRLRLVISYGLFGKKLATPQANRNPSRVAKVIESRLLNLEPG